MIERTIREDADGLFLITNGCVFRPGPLYYALRPGLRTDAANLKRGDKVKTRLMPNPVVEIVLPNGDKLYWEDIAHKQSERARGKEPSWPA